MVARTFRSGRPPVIDPYGYAVVDGGDRRNPRKAAEGFRLRQLAVAQRQAEVVQRIFAEYGTATVTGLPVERWPLTRRGGGRLAGTARRDWRRCHPCQAESPVAPTPKTA